MAGSAPGLEETGAGGDQGRSARVPSALRLVSGSWDWEILELGGTLGKFAPAFTTVARCRER